MPMTRLAAPLAAALLGALLASSGCETFPDDTPHAPSLREPPLAPGAHPTPESAAVLGADAVESTRFVHGAPQGGVPGPFALAGHRIGRDALARLGASRDRPWDLLVTHRSPPEERWACIMDGVAAATGVSAGKLNLRFEPVRVSEAAASATAPETPARDAAAQERTVQAGYSSPGRGNPSPTPPAEGSDATSASAWMGPGSAPAPAVTIVEDRRTGRALEYRLTKGFVQRMIGVRYEDFPEAEKRLEKMKDDEVFEVREVPATGASAPAGPR